MDDIVSMKLKNHKEYGQKILIVVLKCSSFNSASVLEKILPEYQKYLEENPGLSTVFDTRSVKYINPKAAWDSTNVLCKINSIARQNVLCSAIIMDNKLIIELFNNINKAHPSVVPYKIVTNNQEALDFVTQKMKNKLDETKKKL